MTDENNTSDASLAQQVLDATRDWQRVVNELRTEKDGITRHNAVLRDALDDYDAADRRWSADLREANATISRLRAAAREASTAVRAALHQPSVEWSYQEQADRDEAALDAIDALDAVIGGAK
jgi:hypothetical protein